MHSQDLLIATCPMHTHRSRHTSTYFSLIRISSFPKHIHVNMLALDGTKDFLTHISQVELFVLTPVFLTAVHIVGALLSLQQPESLDCHTCCCETKHLFN